MFYKVLIIWFVFSFLQGNSKRLYNVVLLSQCKNNLISFLNPILEVFGDGDNITETLDMTRRQKMTCIYSVMRNSISGKIWSKTLKTFVKKFHGGFGVIG